MLDAGQPVLEAAHLACRGEANQAPHAGGVHHRGLVGVAREGERDVLAAILERRHAADQAPVLGVLDEISERADLPAPEPLDLVPRGRRARRPA
ncbi:MAG: hypothetical protein R3286_19430, partial [Gammaproteobacteria bacterium]|nr:hypothetical protein [Gammaproteobacteria bacterium]